jgi:hypothetical protein
MTFTEHYNNYLKNVSGDLYWHNPHWFDGALKVAIYVGLVISKVEQKLIGGKK